jgi:transposase
MQKYTSKLINLPGYVITKSHIDNYRLVFWAKLRSKLGFCHKCKAKTKIVYETRWRKIKHSFWDHRPCKLNILVRKFKCRSCKTRFWESLPGLQKYARRTEALKKQIAKDALAGYNNKSVSRKYNIGEATVQRDINHYTDLELRKKSSTIAPRILGIDEHFFTKKIGYVTTFCDLQRRKVFDITPGRSEHALEGYLRRLKHRDRTDYVVMDLSATYRSIVQKYFPNAQIITDRFHVIRLVILRCLATWKILDQKGRDNIGLLSLFRRNPAKLSLEQHARLHRYLQSKPGLEALYKLKNRLVRFCNLKAMKFRYARRVISYFFTLTHFLKKSGFQPLVSLAKTLENWQEEILRMMRYTKSNGITEGFHNKMKRIVRIAYGFRNFKNYRNRVLLQCG